MMTYPLKPGPHSAHPSIIAALEACQKSCACMQSHRVPVTARVYYAQSYPYFVHF